MPKSLRINTTTNAHNMRLQLAKVQQRLARLDASGPVPWAGLWRREDLEAARDNLLVAISQADNREAEKSPYWNWKPQGSAATLPTNAAV